MTWSMIPRSPVLYRSKKLQKHPLPFVGRQSFLWITWIHLSVPGDEKHNLDRWFWLQSEQRAAPARSLRLPRNSIRSNRLSVVRTPPVLITQPPSPTAAVGIVSSWRLLPVHMTLLLQKCLLSNKGPVPHRKHTVCLQLETPTSQCCLGE
jgi:hypothetical protein